MKAYLINSIATNFGQDKYLNILAALSRITNKDENRQKMLKAENSGDFYSEFCKSAFQEIQAI